MVTFVLLAAALSLAAVAVVVVPLLRPTPAGTAPASRAALVSTTLLLLGAAGLYVCWSNWPWHAPPPGNSPQPWWRASRATSSTIRRIWTAG
jgi:hypothetical protein